MTMEPRVFTLYRIPRYTSSVTIHQAVRALRTHTGKTGKTQQIFAMELGMSISSLVNDERNRTPEPKQLLIFFAAARDASARISPIYSTRLP